MVVGSGIGRERGWFGKEISSRIWTTRSLLVENEVYNANHFGSSGWFKVISLVGQLGFELLMQVCLLRGRRLV